MDCGYVCISAALASHGQRKSVAEIKRVGGSTSRGLTLRQLRDILTACGAECDAIHFDKSNIASFPCPGILLLSEGHYIYLADVAADKFEIFDPNLGWCWVSKRILAAKTDGFGLLIHSISTLQCDHKTSHRPNTLRMFGVPFFLKHSSFKSLSLQAISEITILAVPLVSMWSIDSVFGGAVLDAAGEVGTAFLAVSILMMLLTTWANLTHRSAVRSAARSFHKSLFRSLSLKPTRWFEGQSATAIQNKFGSADILFNFTADFMNALGGLVVSLIAGVAILFFVSPWLALPGLISLFITIGIELSFNKAHLREVWVVSDANQRKNRILVDAVGQLPLVRRHGGIRYARARYQKTIARYISANARLEGQREWRGLITGLIRSGETLLFLTIAAILLKESQYTLGGFVALGAYKDLLSQSLSKLFQLRQRHRALEVHRLQFEDLEDDRENFEYHSTEVLEGRLEVDNVSYSYGSLDSPAFSGINFVADQGDFLVIRGASGAGKSTLAKLITGLIQPTHGHVWIDGHPPSAHMLAYGAVLQTDRLISGSIRDNLTLMNRDIDDARIWEALKIARAEEFVRALPMRLNTFVSDNASAVSGGQKQRLFIARALLQKPRLLVLDEATSSLEVDTERQIFATLHEMGMTLVVISHRPEVWSMANKIVTIDESGANVHEPHVKATSSRVDAE